MAQSAGYKAAATRSGPNVSKGAQVAYVGGRLVGTSGNAASAARQAAQYGQSAEGVLGYANPDYYIKDVRDSQGNIISTGGTLTLDSRGEIIDSAGGNYGNVTAEASWDNYLRNNPTEGIQEQQAQQALQAQQATLEQRKAEQAQYAAERAAQEYSGATSEMYGNMAREQATEGATRPSYEPQSTFTRQTTKDGKRFADSPTSDNYQNVYREESIFGSQTTEVAQGTTDLQKMERMLINAKIGNTEKELDSLNQQIALSDQKLKKISSFEKAKDAQKGGSGVAGGVTEQYLETSNSEYAAEKRQMDKLKTQQSQMQMVLAQQTREKEQMGSLTAAFDRNVQGISSDPAPMDSDPVVGNYGEQPAMSSAGRVEKFPGLADSVVDPNLRISDVAEDASNIKYGWGGTDPRFSWAQTRSQFNTGTESAPSLIIPGTEGEKRDELSKVFYGAIDPNQTGIMTGGRDDGGINYVNIGQGGQAVETYTDDLGREQTRIVRTFDPIQGEERDTVQALYARQFEDTMMNREQQEYFKALTGGEVSISDALTKPRTAQSYISDGVRSEERPDGNLGIWLAEQNLKGDERMDSITWREPRSTGAQPGTESARSEPKQPVSVPEGTTYTPDFDATYRQIMTPVEMVGPPAPQKLTPEATKALGEYIGEVKEFHGSDVTEYQIMYTNPQGAVSIINVAPNDLERNYANLIGLGVQPDSMQLTPQYSDRIAPLSPNIAIASSIFAPRISGSETEGKLPPRKSLIGGIDLSTEEGRLQYMQEGEWYEKAFKGVAAEVTNVLYVADNLRQRGVNVDQWSEGWEITVFDTILNPYTKPFESPEFKEFFDTEKALYEQSQAKPTTQAIGRGGGTKQSTDSSPDWMIYLKYMSTDTYSKQYSEEQKKETEFFIDNAWYMVPNTIAFVGTFGINVGLGTIQKGMQLFAKGGLKAAETASTLSTKGILPKAFGFKPMITQMDKGFRINTEVLAATESGTVAQKLGIFLQEKAFPVETGLARALYKQIPSITQYDQPVAKVDQAADLVQLPRQMESLAGSTRGVTEEVADPIYLRMDDVGNLPPSRPQPLASEPPIVREAMPLGWAEGRMSQAPPVAWKQDVITTEIVKVGRYDDIQVQPDVSTVSKTITNPRTGEALTWPSSIPRIGGQTIKFASQEIRNPGVYKVKMSELGTGVTVETTATIYQKTFPKTGRWGGMFQTKYDPEQTGLGILDPLTGKVSDTKLSELPGAIRIPRYGRQGVYTDYYLDMTPVVEQSGLMGTLRGEQLLLSEMTIRASAAQAMGLKPVSLRRGAPEFNEQLVADRLEETISADLWTFLPATKTTVGKTIPQEQLAIKADQVLQRVIGYSDIMGGAGKVDVPTSGLRAGYLDDKGVFRLDREAIKKNYPEVYQATRMDDDQLFREGFELWRDTTGRQNISRGGAQLEYLRTVQQRVDPLIGGLTFSSGKRTYPLPSSIIKARESFTATQAKIQKLRDDFEPRQKKGEVTEEQTAEYSQAMDALADESIKGNKRIKALNKELGVVNMQILRRDQNLQFGRIKNVSGSQMFKVLDDSGMSERIQVSGQKLPALEKTILSQEQQIVGLKARIEREANNLGFFETMKKDKTLDIYADVPAEQITNKFTKDLEAKLAGLRGEQKQMQVELTRIRGVETDKPRLVTDIELRFLNKSYNQRVQIFRDNNPELALKDPETFASQLDVVESQTFDEWLAVGRFKELQGQRYEILDQLNVDRYKGLFKGLDEPSTLPGQVLPDEKQIKELRKAIESQPEFVYGYFIKSPDTPKAMRSDISSQPDVFVRASPSDTRARLYEIGERGYASVQAKTIQENIKTLNLAIKGYESSLVQIKKGVSPFFTSKPVTGSTPQVVGGSDPLASARVAQAARLPDDIVDESIKYLKLDKEITKLEGQKTRAERGLLSFTNQEKALDSEQKILHSTIKKALWETWVRPEKIDDEVMSKLVVWMKTQRKYSKTGGADDRFWAKMLNLKPNNFKKMVIENVDAFSGAGKTQKGIYESMTAPSADLTTNQKKIARIFNSYLQDSYRRWNINTKTDDVISQFKFRMEESQRTGTIPVQSQRGVSTTGWSEGYVIEDIPQVRGYKIKGGDVETMMEQGGAQAKFARAWGLMDDLKDVDTRIATLNNKMRLPLQRIQGLDIKLTRLKKQRQVVTDDTGVAKVGTGDDLGGTGTFILPETVPQFTKSYDTAIKILSSSQRELKSLQGKMGANVKARNTMVKNIDTWSAQLVKDQKYDKTKLPIWGGKQIYVSLSALTQIKTAGGKFGAAGPSRMGAAIFGYITGQPLPGAKTLKDMGLARDAIITKDYIVAKEFGITREPMPVGGEIPGRIDSPNLDKALRFFGFKPPERVDFAKIRELEGMDYETGAILGLERLGLVSGQDAASIQQPSFKIGEVVRGLLSANKDDRKYFGAMVKETFGITSQPINEYDKAMNLFALATEKLKIVSQARKDPVAWIEDFGKNKFDDVLSGMDATPKKPETGWKPGEDYVSIPPDPNAPYRPQAFTPEPEPSKAMQRALDNMERNMNTSWPSKTKDEGDIPIYIQNLYKQMGQRVDEADTTFFVKGARLESGKFVDEESIVEYGFREIDGQRLGDLSVQKIKVDLSEFKMGEGQTIIEKGRLVPYRLPTEKPSQQFTEKQLQKMEKEAMELFDEGKEALPSRSLFDTDLKPIPEDLFKNVRAVTDDAVILKSWLGGDFMPAFFRPPPPSRPKSVLRDASKGSFDTSSDDASQRLVTMLKTEDVKITQEPLGPSREALDQVAKADPLKPVMESISDDILFSAPRNLAASLRYQRPFYPSYRSIFENVYNTQAPTEADILGVLQGGSASAMAPSIPLARPQVPQLGADPTIQFTLPQIRPVIEGILPIQTPDVTTLISSALRQPQMTAPVLDLTQRLDTPTDLGQVGRQRLQLDGIQLSRAIQLLDVPLQEAVRTKPRALPPVMMPLWMDPYDKRRRPKKKKAKKRKKRKIWWDVPDSPFKPFSAKEYKVFTGAEPARITRLERRRFPFENWGNY